MKYHVGIYGLLLIVLLFMAMPLFAVQTRAIEPVLIKDKQGKQVGLYKESHALVIGASHYTKGWPKLPGVKEDIRKVTEVLGEHGFAVVTVNDPDKEELRDAFENFINTYGQKPENRLLFYFAGHGFTKKLSYGDEMGYIIPVDAPDPEADPGGFSIKAMDMEIIEVFAKRIQSKHALFLFDSCFSGSLFALSRAIPKSISYKTSRPVRQFITSGSAEETVSDKSTFRVQFVAALEGEGDVNEDGYVTGTELGQFLQDTVINYTNESQHPQYGKIRNRNLDKGDFVFALRGDIYEPRVQMPSKPKVVEEFGFGNIDEKRKKRREDERKLAELKTEWAEWQKRFDSAYDKALEYDKDKYVSTSEKVQVWKRLADSFGQDNPYSTSDQLIRNKAMDRLKYWRNYREPRQPVIREEPLYGNVSATILRSSYKNLSVSQVPSMPNISIRKKEKWGFYGYSTIKHSYKKESINGDKVVVDHATGLMWHQNGSDEYINYKKAKKWLKTLNRSGYAGYNDWRLPTVEEAASLLESSEKNGDLYIDPVFSYQQEYIWTGDKKYGSGSAWLVHFYGGYVYWSIHGSHYVRPVRSGL